MAGNEIVLLVLGRDDVEKALSFRDVIDTVEESQRAWGSDHAVSAAITGLSVSPEVACGKHGNFMYYGAYLGERSLNVAGLSWIACCIHNPEEFGLPYATGIQIVSNTLTGVPLAVMERSRLTEMITAGTSAVGAKHLANPDAGAVGVIGCGNQGRTHLQALAELFDIQSVKAFDARAESLAKYVDDMSEKLGMDVQAAASGEDVARDADILVVCISPVKPTVRGEWIKPGALVIAMSGGGGELHPCVYPVMDRIVVDDAGHSYKRHFESMKSKGLIEQDHYPELGKIVAGKETGRTHPDERILFMHSGQAVNHTAGGYLTYTKATEKGLGARIRIL